MSDFSACLAFVLSEEGGWADNPDDPGGATMRGVTLKTFQHYFPGSTANALRNITESQLETIYSTGYWNPMRCDALLSGVNLCAFDMAVNSGPARSVKLLQAAAGVTVDGVLGPVTMAALSKMAPAQLIPLFGAKRQAYYESLDDFDEFGGGWTGRAERCTATALKLASQSKVGFGV